jgi:fructose-bisphosphate aldolase class II
MTLIVDREHVQDIYAEAEGRRWVLPAFNVENLTACEAILQAVREYGEEIGIINLPIIIGITNQYAPRPQAVYYTQTRQWEVGMRLFLADLNVLTSKGSPYQHLRVMIHFDHIQWDIDKELQSWDMNYFSSIMFDVSMLSFVENIEKTASFVEQYKKMILIEGACDEIGVTTVSEKDGLTNSDLAEKYYRETGIDLIVANLGTEHRAAGANLNYNSQLAKYITKRIGPRLCLHGTSSVSPDKLINLFDDGIRKANVWTVLERTATEVLFQEMLQNAAKVTGPEIVKDLINSKIFGEKVNPNSALSVSYFPTTYRQEIVYQSMKKTVIGFLRKWYK